MQAPEVQLRVARVEDSAELLRIYAPYVEETTASFEYVVPSEEEFRQRVEAVLPVYPYLVAERSGRIVGYAYAHRHAERAAYDWNAELSIYLTQEVCGAGIGRLLYEALMRILKEQGVYNVYALVSSPNPASEAFHRAMGFSLAGTWHHTGFKHGRWLDILHFEKALRPPQPAPSRPITPFASLGGGSTPAGLV